MYNTSIFQGPPSLPQISKNQRLLRLEGGLSRHADPVTDLTSPILGIRERKK